VEPLKRRLVRGIRLSSLIPPLQNTPSLVRNLPKRVFSNLLS